MGWFITNSVLESPDPEPAACAAAVKEAVRLGSWPLAEVFVPWGGMPEAPGMFAVSWLDLRRLPVRVDAAGLDAQYVGASIRSDGVMLWFIIDETGLHLRCRYPDTDEARRHVGGWLDALALDLRARAAESVGGVLELGERRYRVRRAVRTDVASIVALLADDGIEVTQATLSRDLLDLRLKVLRRAAATASETPGFDDHPGGREVLHPFGVHGIGAALGTGEDHRRCAVVDEFEPQRGFLHGVRTVYHHHASQPFTLGACGFGTRANLADQGIDVL